MKTLRKLFRRILAAIIGVVVAVLLLCTSLYFQPMQQWAIDALLAVASNQTATRITVANASLSWPLNLSVDSLRIEEPSIEHQSIEVLSAGHAEANIQMLPLLLRQVMIDKLRLEQVSVNSTHFIDDMVVKGEIGELTMEAHGINTIFSTADLDEAMMRGARLHIEMTDTTTDDEPLEWRVKMERLLLEDSRFDITMAPDSTNHRDRLTAHFGLLTLRDADLNMDKMRYRLDSIMIDNSQLAYNNTMSLSHLSGQANNIVYNDDSLSATIPHATARETLSGLQLDTLSMHIKLADSLLQIPSTRFVTPQSAFTASMSVDLKVMNDSLGNEIEESPSFSFSLKKKKLEDLPQTPIVATIKGAFHKQDLLRLAKMSDKGVPWAVRQVWPNKAIKLGVTVRGDMKKLKISGFKGELPDEVELLE